MIGFLSNSGIFVRPSNVP